MYEANGDNPRRPERSPMPEPTPRGSLLPVLMVLVPLVIFIVGIVAFTGRAGLLILAAIAGVPALMMLHYLLWGHWLGRILRENDQREPEPGDSDD